MFIAESDFPDTRIDTTLLSVGCFVKGSSGRSAVLKVKMFPPQNVKYFIWMFNTLLTKGKFSIM